MDEIRAELIDIINDTLSMRVLNALRAVTQVHRDDLHGKPAIKAVLMLILALELTQDEMTTLYMAAMRLPERGK